MPTALHILLGKERINLKVLLPHTNRPDTIYYKIVLLTHTVCVSLNMYVLIALTKCIFHILLLHYAKLLRSNLNT